MNVCLHCMYVKHMYLATCRGQKKALVTLELEQNTILCKSNKWSYLLVITPDPRF